MTKQMQLTRNGEGFLIHLKNALYHIYSSLSKLCSKHTTHRYTHTHGRPQPNLPAELFSIKLRQTTDRKGKGEDTEKKLFLVLHWALVAGGILSHLHASLSITGVPGWVASCIPGPCKKYGSSQCEDRRDPSRIPRCCSRASPLLLAGKTRGRGGGPEEQRLYRWILPPSPVKGEVGQKERVRTPPSPPPPHHRSTPPAPGCHAGCQGGRGERESQAMGSLWRGSPSCQSQSQTQTRLARRGSWDAFQGTDLAQSQRRLRPKRATPPSTPKVGGGKAEMP